LYFEQRKLTDNYIPLDYRWCETTPEKCRRQREALALQTMRLLFQHQKIARGQTLLKKFKE